MTGKRFWYGVLSFMLLVPLFVILSVLRADSARLPWEYRCENAINAQRLSRGIEPMDFDRLTDRWAEQWVRKIPYNGFQHSDMYGLLSYANARKAGEIMVWGTPLPFTPREAVRAWLNSPGHKAVMLDPDYEFIGIGSIRVNGTRYVVADLTVR